MNAVSIRGEWVGTTVDGRFPLIEWLGGSGNSGTFLTELPSPAETPGNSGSILRRRAAIKLIPASSGAEDRPAIWVSAASMSHPHLARILHFGRAEIDGTGLLYVVTELAEEILSQILPDRQLTSEETRQLLPPVLDALAYVHALGLVHGHVKPSNILVVNDEIKLSTDSLLRAGKPVDELLQDDIHRAPEIDMGVVAPSADLWSLGVMLVEALTTQAPHWNPASDAEPQIPASLPTPFDEIARECLRVDPAQRATISDVRALLEGRPKPAAIAPHLPYHPHRLVERTAAPKIPLIPLIAGFFLLLAIIIGLQMHSCRRNSAPLHTEKTAAVRSPASQAMMSQGAVINRVEPDVPRAASDTIHGTVTVTVRVTVDAAGAVTNAELESRGPSAYFARLARESARNWTFRPPLQNGKPVPSTWLLHYEFRSDRTEVMAEALGP
jgi:TonB family protein